PLNDAAHLFQSRLSGRIVVHKGLRETHGPDGQANHVLDMPIDGERQLTTAATKVDEQRAAMGDERVGKNAEMDEPALFQSRDDLNSPSRSGAYPIDKGAAVVCVAQCAGRHHAHSVHGVLLGRAMKAPQHLHGAGHRLRVEHSSSENALTQACDLSVFVEGLEAAAHGLCYLQAD